MEKELIELEREGHESVKLVQVRGEIDALL